MIAKLFSRRPKKAAVAAPAIPEGRRIYAIGDIHGRVDLLDALLDRIVEDERKRGGPCAELVFLGDLVDRGPASAQVVDRLIALRDERPGTRFLLGNHEEVFLSALGGDKKALRLFHRIGGAETILSYGITPDAYVAADFDGLAAMFQAAVPEAHRAFLESFEDMIVAGDYVFVHAGIRPGVPLEEQRPGDLRWIRDEFLSHAEPLEKVVVHGHSIFEEVMELPHRIGLDTGAYRHGVLTAMGFEGTDRWILQAHCQLEAAAA
jgi:serine/threonine protein phosphatase 1